MEFAEVGQERRPRRIGRRILLGVAVVGGAVLAARYGMAAARGSAASAAPGMLASGAARAPGPIVPAGTRIRVEVLNATGEKGVARAATFALRDAGFDVVFFGNSTERRDSTLVVDRLDHPEWARLAARAMRVDRSALVARPDSGRYVDLTILVGRNWAPPRQPFHP